MLERPKFYENATEEQLTREYINYLRNNTEESIINAERKYWTDECKRVGVADFMIENQIKPSIEYALSQKKFFDSMSDELVEKYINQEMNRRELLKYEIGQTNGKLYQSIKNIRYLTEQENSFKKHIKNQLKKLVKNEDLLITLGSSSILAVLVSEITEKIVEANNYGDFPSKTTILSLIIATQIIILGYQPIKQWIEMNKNNSEDIERLKKAGIYDLLIDAVESKREYEELYQQEQGRRRG